EGFHGSGSNAEMMRGGPAATRHDPPMMCANAGWLRADGAHLLHLFVAQLGEERLDAREALLQLLGRAGVGNAQRPRLAECGARHRRDELVFQQRLAEIDVVFDRLAVVRLAERDRDVRERVERALWT